MGNHFCSLWYDLGKESNLPTTYQSQGGRCITPSSKPWITPPNMTQPEGKCALKLNDWAGLQIAKSKVKKEALKAEHKYKNKLEAVLPT